MFFFSPRDIRNIKQPPTKQAKVPKDLQARMTMKSERRRNSNLATKRHNAKRSKKGKIKKKDEKEPA